MPLDELAHLVLDTSVMPFMPAARKMDMHVCPMQTPAVVPIPHVGGPINAPCAMRTFIGGMPAARATDMLICVGPPDVIVQGSPTVLIEGLPAARVGDQCAHGGKIVMGYPTVMIGDSGGGSPQAATLGSAQATGSAFTETGCNAPGRAGEVAPSSQQAPPDPKTTTWVEIATVDADSRPLAHQKYRVEAPDGKVYEGFTGTDGIARIPGLKPGSCKITFPDLDGRSWAKA